MGILEEEGRGRIGRKECEEMGGFGEGYVILYVLYLRHKKGNDGTKNDGIEQRANGEAEICVEEITKVVKSIGFLYFLYLQAI